MEEQYDGPTAGDFQRPSRRQYSYAYALFHPFFSAAFYRDVATNWSGLAVRHLLVLAVLSMGACVLHDRPAAYFGPIIGQLPAIIVKNGEVSIDRPMPYLIGDSDGRVWAAIDTGAEANAAYSYGDEFVVLLTRTQLVNRTGPDISTTKLGVDDSFELTRESVARWSMRIEKWGDVVIFVGVSAIFAAYRLVQVFLCGAVGVGLGKALGAELRYSAAARVAAMALTPAALADTLISAIGYPIPLLLFWPAAGLTTCVYLYLGVRAVVGRDRSGATGEGQDLSEPQVNGGARAGTGSGFLADVPKWLVAALTFGAGMGTTLVGQMIAAHFEARKTQRQEQMAAMQAYSSACSRVRADTLAQAWLPFQLIALEADPSLSKEEKYKEIQKVARETVQQLRKDYEEFETKSRLVNVLFHTQVKPEDALSTKEMYNALVQPLDEVPTEEEAIRGWLAMTPAQVAERYRTGGLALLTEQRFAQLKMAQRLSSYCEGSTRALAKEIASR